MARLKIWFTERYIIDGIDSRMKVLCFYVRDISLLDNHCILANEEVVVGQNTTNVID